MNNQKYRTGSLIILIIVSGGYHGYYIPTGELGYWWLILFVAGMIAFITFYVRESTHRKGNSLRMMCFVYCSHLSSPCGSCHMDCQFL